MKNKQFLYSLMQLLLGLSSSIMYADENDVPPVVTEDTFPDIAPLPDDAGSVTTQSSPAPMGKIDPKKIPVPVRPYSPNAGNNASVGKDKGSAKPKDIVDAKMSSKSPMSLIPPGKELVSIDFPEPTAIKDLIKAVGQWTGKNFILGTGVSSSAKVQIISPQKVTREEAYQAFLSALNVAGYTTVDTGKMVKIVLARNAVSSNIKTYFGSTWSPMTDEVITQIIPLVYVDATNVANQLRSLLKDSNVVPFQTTNSLIMTDTGHKIRRTLEIIRMLDVKSNQPQVVIQPILNLDAGYVQKKITEIYSASARGSSNYLQKAIHEERSNSLILIGPPRGLDDVVRLIRRIDKPLEDANSQSQIHVLPLDYAEADKMATTLQNLAQGTGAKNNSFLFSRPATPKKEKGGSTAAVADLAGVKITADKATNSLIIMGSKSAYLEVESIVKLLDKRRDQVFVEADIIDVNTGNDFDFSASIFAGSPAANNRAIIPAGWQVGRIKDALLRTTDPTLQAAQAQGIVSNFGSNTILGILGSQKISFGGIDLSPGAFLFALKSDVNSNVLQTPSLLVSDNEEANFESTSRQWFKNSTEDAVTKTVSTKREPVDATLSLKINPQVSKAEFVNMAVVLKAENFGSIGAEGPEDLNKRASTTKVSVQNGQTIVISGLNKSSESEKLDKVPLLGDIPILGWLFRDTKKKKQKTNLMIFITPHVIRNSQDLANIYERKNRERDEYLKAIYGERFKDKEFYKSLPTPERGQVPTVQKSTPVEESQESTPLSTEDDKKSEVLPSQDPDPIVAPGGGVGSGGESFSSPAGDLSPFGGDGGPEPGAPGESAIPQPPPPAPPSSSGDKPQGN